MVSTLLARGARPDVRDEKGYATPTAPLTTTTPTPFHRSTLNPLHITISTLPPPVLPSWTPLLYADFKAREDCILTLLAVDPHSQLVLLGELLKQQHRGGHRDARIARVLRGLTVVPSYLRFINDLVARSPELLETSLSFMLDNPDLLDLRNKVGFFLSAADRKP